MATITIDNRQVEVPAGATILDAARKAGIEIPTLCHRAELEPATSCMVCVVKVDGRERLLPACATRVADGMTVESDTPEVQAARRVALELLLADHLGDCAAPCQVVCPAHMDIPAMLRHLAAGRLRDALITIKEHIPLPASLSRVCSAPCERGCRRAQWDGAVAIRELKRYAADADLAAETPYLPEIALATGKRIAIVGAGPSGLTAAYYLLRDGHACTVYDAAARAGGSLRSAVQDEVLDAEIAVIARMGARFHLHAIPPEDELRACDAVLLTTEDAAMAEQPGVFTVHERKDAIHAVADGRFMASTISRHLAGEDAPSERRPYTTHVGKLSEEELAVFVEGAERAPRDPALRDPRREAARCLHCDCRKAQACKLRDYGRAYGASPGKFRGERRRYTRDDSHPEVIYEAGKCIDCGICVQLASRDAAGLGLAFIGRGFDVRVAVPFQGTLAEGLAELARQCAAACPTGALVVKE